MLEDPFLLYTIPYEWEGEDCVITTKAINQRPSYLETTCHSFHTEPAHAPETPPKAAKITPPSPIGALSRLRTCRLIHTEAKPLLEDNLSLHVCDKFTLIAAIDGRTPSLPLSQIRSLDFCAQVTVMWNFNGGFLPARGLPDGHPAMKDDWDMWAEWQRSIRHVSKRSGVPRLPHLSAKLAHLQNATLFVCFECVPFQGNDRKSVINVTSRRRSYDA